MARQLATLLEAGVQLPSAVESLARHRTRARMAATLDAVRAQLLEGSSFAAAMTRHPEVFPQIYTGMIEAGEASGALEIVLRRIAEHAESQARLSRRVRAAMTYPAIMAVVGSGIVLFLLAYVVPQVTRVFLEARQELPVATRALMSAAALVTRHGAWLALGGAAALAALRYSLATDAGRRRAERLVFATPVLGRLARNVVAVRFTQTLATMIAGGLPLVEGLRISRSACGSLLLAGELAGVEEAVIRGESMSGLLADSDMFDPMVADMVRVGERSGDLESMLSRAGTALEEDVDAAVETFASLLEPVTILAMAGIVLFVVLAILMPVFEMNQLVR